MVEQKQPLLNLDRAERLVRYLGEHTHLDLPESYKDELTKNLVNVSQFNPNEFSYKLPSNSVKFDEPEDGTKTHLYVRRVLNNRKTSHQIPSNDVRMAYVHQARIRGGTSTYMYIQNILQNPDLIEMMEETSDDNLVSLLGRIAKDTQITQIMKVRMRRPTLVIPVASVDEAKVRQWEKYGPETRYYEIVLKVPIREITREEYDAIIHAKEEKAKIRTKK